ncbi:AAA family ATPase [Vibrio parahaemolyticus]|nr:AAA family ATPase [Vibrio parahaemolyticus]
MFLDDTTCEQGNIFTKKFGEFVFSLGSSGFDYSIIWLIDKIIALNSFGVIYGPSGSLKSFLSIDLCCSIATGKSWAGYGVNKGAVVYVAAEGINGIKKRVKAWEVLNNETIDKLYILGHGVSISEKSSQFNLIKAIKEIEDQDNVKVQLVVLDTLSRCYLGDENTSRDMTAFVKGCDTIKSAANTSVLCIHHTGRDETKGARGSSALRAACDFEYQVKRKSNSNILYFKNTKQKDDAEVPEIEFEFDIVDLPAMDQNGENIKSLAKIGSKKHYE